MNTNGIIGVTRDDLIAADGGKTGPAVTEYPITEQAAAGARYLLHQEQEARARREAYAAGIRAMLGIPAHVPIELDADAGVVRIVTEVPA